MKHKNFKKIIYVMISILFITTIIILSNQTFNKTDNILKNEMSKLIKKQDVDSNGELTFIVKELKKQGYLKKLDDKYDNYYIKAKKNSLGIFEYKLIQKPKVIEASNKIDVEEKEKVEKIENIENVEIKNDVLEETYIENNTNIKVKEEVVNKKEEIKEKPKEEAKATENTEIEIVLDKENKYTHELGEEKKSLNMSVKTNVDDVVMAVDDTNVNYDKPGTYKLRFLAESPMRNKKVSKEVPFTVEDTKAPSISIMPEKTENPAEGVKVSITAKDPSGLKNAKYVWYEDGKEIPKQGWKDVEAHQDIVKVHHSIVSSKDEISVDEGKIRVAVKAEDTVGHTGKNNSQTYVISKHVPTSIQFTPNTAEYTNKNVKLEIQYNNASRQKYKIGKGRWTNYTLPIEIAENTTVLAQATNGDKTVFASFEITNIDKEAPNQIVLNPNEYINETPIADLEINIKCKDSLCGFDPLKDTLKYQWVKVGENVTENWNTLALNSFSKGDKEVTSKIVNSLDKGKYKLYLKCIDAVGNEVIKSSGEYNLYNYNLVKPTFTVTPEKGFVNDKLTVTINKNPNEPEEKIYYSFDSTKPVEEWIEYKGKLDITEEKTIYAYAKSKTGKNSLIAECTIKDRIDKDSPIVSFKETTMPVKNIEAEFTAEDVGKSGIQKIEYAWVDKEVKTWQVLENINSRKLPVYNNENKTGDKKLFIKVTDNANNQIIISKVYTFDNELPKVEIKSPNDKLYKMLTPEVNVTDNSNIVSCSYGWSDKDAEESTVVYTKFTDNYIAPYGFNINSEKKLWIKAVDSVGNTNIQSKTFTFDNVKPNLDITTSDKKYHRNLSVNFITDEKHIASIEYAWTDKNVNMEPTKDLIKLDRVDVRSLPIYNNDNKTGEKMLWLVIKDTAGNKRVKTKIFKFDNDKPKTIFITPNNKDYKTVDVQIKVTDNHTKVNEVYYAWTEPMDITGEDLEYQKTSLEKVNTYGYNQTGARYLWIKAIDEVGNYSITKNEYSFDNSAPRINIITNPSITYKSVKVELEIRDKDPNIEKYFAWTDENAEVKDSDYINFNSDILDEYGNNFTGNKVLTIKAQDSLGNVNIKKQTYHFDNTLPKIEIKTDGTIPQKAYRVEYKVSDNVEVKKVEYAWTDENLEPVSMIEVPKEDTSLDLFNNNNQSGEKYLWIRATDKTGNVNKLSKVFKFDNKEPVVKFVEDTVNKKEYKTVTPKMIATDENGIQKLAYTWTEENVTDYRTLKYEIINTVDDIPEYGFDINGKKKLWIGALDNAGNVKVINKIITFDNILPVVEIVSSNANIYKSLIPVVTATEETGSLVTEYAWSKNLDATENEVEKDFKVYTGSSIPEYAGQTGARKLIIRATDEAGNKTITSKKFAFDNTAPIVNILNKPEEKDLYRYLTVNFDVKDDYQICKIEYAWTDTSITSFPESEAKTLDVKERSLPSYTHTEKPCTKKVWIKVIDCVGNETVISQEYKMTNEYLDKILNFAITTDNTIYRKNVDVEFITEDINPQDKITYVWTDENVQEMPLEGVKELVYTDRKLPNYDNNKVTGNKKVWIHINDGKNDGTIYKVFKFDHEMPTVKIITDSTPKYKNVVVIAEALDNQKIKSVEYVVSSKLDSDGKNLGYIAAEKVAGENNKYKTVVAGENITGKKKIFFKVTDEAGNQVITSKIYTFDNNPPVVTIEPQNTTIYKTVTPIVTAMDSEGNIIKKEYAWTNTKQDVPNYITYNDSIPTYGENITGHQILWVRITDEAGNVTVENKEYNLDNTKPEIKIIEERIETGKVSLKVSVSDNGVPLYNITNAKYTICEKGKTPSTEKNILTNGYIEELNLKHNTEYEFKITYTDYPGNKGELVHKVKTNEILMPEITYSNSLDKWTNKNVATIDYKKFDQTLTYYLKIDGKENLQEISSENSKVIYNVLLNNTKLAAVVKDDYGNVVETQEIIFDHIDSVKPKVEILSTEVLYNSAYFELNLNTIGASGFKEYQYKVYKETDKEPAEFIPLYWDGIQLYDLTQDTAYILKIKAINNAGYESEIVTERFTTLKDDLLGNPNKPVLAKGMIPVKYVNNSWYICGEDDPEWYNYKNKLWANIMLSDGTYKNRYEIGRKVAEKDLGSMFVWIPRYSYSINSFATPKNGEGKTQEITKVRFLENNTNNEKSGKQSIPQIRNAKPSLGKETEEIVHPGFKFGEEEIEGLWVAKYEARKNAQNEVKILQSLQKLNSINIGDAFETCINMKQSNIYGLPQNNDVDIHLMKNSEWETVSYLAASKYGVTPTNTQSTTNNITGVYELNGGNNEFVAGYYDNENKNISKYGKAKYFANNKLDLKYSKYWDKYLVSSEEKKANNNLWEKSNSENKLRKSLTDARFNLNNKDIKEGLGLKEITNKYSYYGKDKTNKYIWTNTLEANKEEYMTSFYNDDYVLVGHCNLPFIVRGGSDKDLKGSGIFSHKEEFGEGRQDIGFRPVIRVVKKPPMPDVKLILKEDIIKLNSAEFTLSTTNISEYGLKHYKYKIYKANEQEPVDFIEYNNNKLVIDNLFENTDYVLKVKAVDNDYRESNIVTYKFKTLSAVKANKPIISGGMIPIKYVNNNWQICKETDKEWYDYDNKKAANVMLSDGMYKDKNAVGQIVEDENLGSMFVWVPRYAYSINNYKVAKNAQGITQNITDVTFLKNKTNIGMENGVEVTYPKDYDVNKVVVGSKTPKIVHPAFTFGTKELSGMWVAKFEASNELKVLPNKIAWTNIQIGDAFSNCYNMKNDTKYGLPTNVNTHLMKNSEWGALAYLASSQYGITPDVNPSRLNNMQYTAGSSEVGGYKKNVKQSTTNNVTGIYDLSGGCWEVVSAYFDNNNVNFDRGTISSYFTNRKLINTYVDYFDRYDAVNENANWFLGSRSNPDRINFTNERYKRMANKKGDATYEIIKNYSYFLRRRRGGVLSSETYDWEIDGDTTNYGRMYYNNDFCFIGHTRHTFMVRGGSAYNTIGDGIFALSTGEGKANEQTSFRPVIYVE